jgi:F-type H+-transporting ATPase subunit alpha
MSQIGEGEWSDEIESQLGDCIGEALDDFGPDFDEEGNPLEEGESDRIRSEEEREKEARTDEGRASADEDDRGQTPEDSESSSRDGQGSDPSEEREQETAKA